MAVIDPRTWLEHLSIADCWELLASVPVGRIGMVVDGGPEVLPVNYVVDGESIVFRTEVGSKLHAIDRAPKVCFEVDAIDTERLTGWSVLVKGKAAEIDTAAGMHQASRLPLRYWSVGDKPHWVRIVPTEVTGRRIRPA